MTSFFSRFAQDWHDPQGSMKFLHRMNEARCQFIKNHLPQKSGLKGLDLGCGGGLCSKHFLEQGHDLDLVDSSSELLSEAEIFLHDYRDHFSIHNCGWELFEGMEGSYDFIICLEMIEHIPNPKELCKKIHFLLKPGGQVFLSTINQTNLSFLMAIIWAEYISRWLPKKTHDYNLFLSPEDLNQMLSPHICQDLKGLIYNPLEKKFFIGQNLSVNYIGCWRKPTELSS